MSAIGNFDIARPPAAVRRRLRPAVRLEAQPARRPAPARRGSASPRGTSAAINGHRDAGQTACPGRYLYAQLPRIRALAASHQRSWAGRERTTGVAGSVRPVVVARSRATQPAVPDPHHERRAATRGPRAPVPSPRSANRVITAGDWNGDGRGDVITRSGRTGRLWLWRGLTERRLGALAADGRLQLRPGPAAGRRRRHDRRRPPRPARPARGPLHADLPGQRAARVHPQLRRALGARRPRAARDGPVEPRRRSGHRRPAPQREPGALPRQRPRRAHRRHDDRPARRLLRLAGRGRRPHRRRPCRPDRQVDPHATGSGPSAGSREASPPGAPSPAT